jgi:hypothetical protein
MKKLRLSGADQMPLPARLANKKHFFPRFHL